MGGLGIKEFLGIGVIILLYIAFYLALFAGAVWVLVFFIKRSVLAEIGTRLDRIEKKLDERRPSRRTPPVVVAIGLGNSMDWRVCDRIQG